MNECSWAELRERPAGKGPRMCKCLRKKRKVIEISSVELKLTVEGIYSIQQLFVNRVLSAMYLTGSGDMLKK